MLELYGGTLQVEFVDTENVSMVQGGGSIPGVYGILEDGVTLNGSYEIQGESYNYVAVFTDVDG